MTMRTLVIYQSWFSHRKGEDPNPILLHRSHAFPNLGLVFDKSGYERVWKNRTVHMSTNGWDHWLRSIALENDYECVYPSLPRVKHPLSEVGVTTDINRNQRIGMVPWYEDTTPVSLGDLSYILPMLYELSLLKEIVPRPLLLPVYQMMQIPMRSIITGRVNMNITKKNLFSWKEMDDSGNMAILSYKQESEVRRTLQSGSYQKIILVVSSEVGYFFIFLLLVLPVIRTQIIVSSVTTRIP